MTGWLIAGCMVVVGGLAAAWVDYRMWVWERDLVVAVFTQHPIVNLTPPTALEEGMLGDTSDG